MSTGYFERVRRLLVENDPDSPKPLHTFLAGNSTIHLNIDFSIGQMRVNKIADKYRLPDLRASLTDFLSRKAQNKGVLHTLNGARWASTTSPLPFEYLQVWFKLRIQQTDYYNSGNVLHAQVVNAAPPSSTWPMGQYDSVIVNTDAEQSWPQSGLKGT